MRRIGNEGHAACNHYANNVKWIVDPFHIKNHVKEKCNLKSEKVAYHPRMPENIHLTENINMEVRMFFLSS